MVEAYCCGQLTVTLTEYGIIEVRTKAMAGKVKFLKGAYKIKEYIDVSMNQNIKHRKEMGKVVLYINLGG